MAVLSARRVRGPTVCGQPAAGSGFYSGSGRITAEAEDRSWMRRGPNRICTVIELINLPNVN